MKIAVAALLACLMGVTCLTSAVRANPYEDLRQALARARSQSHSFQTSTTAILPRKTKAAGITHGRKLNLHDAIDEAACRSGIPSALLATVVVIESAGDPCAVSHAGAKGLAQLMDGTARDYQVEDSFEPYQNLSGSSRLIRDLLDRNDGKLLAMAASYNAGSRVLTRRWSHWPTETKNYLDKVLRYYPNFTEDRWKTSLPQFIRATNRQICRQSL